MAPSGSLWCQRREAARWRQCALAALGLALAACTPADTLRYVGLGAAGNVGGVAADEPRAAIVARDVLGVGGNAVDAAVALYFVNAVTYPASSSLGAGGACVIWDSEAQTAEALEFPAVAPPSADPEAPLRIALPGAVRAMFAMHARHGNLQWSRLLAPAESLARLGHPVSRALAADIARVAGPLFVNPDMARVFGRPDGTPLQEGDSLVQIDLAAVLSQLRTRGPGVLYSGDVGRLLVAAVNDAGGSLNLDDLRNYRPHWREPLSIPFGVHRLYSVPPPLPGGVAVLQLWRMLDDDDRYADADAEERAHLVAEASMRAFADRAAWREGEVAPADLVSEARVAGLMADYDRERHTPADALDSPPVRRRESASGTSFVVVDAEGDAVACTMTLNNFFGRGWMAPGTGIILAAAPPDGRLAMTGLAPVVIGNVHTGNFIFAGAASGGAAVPAALGNVMARALINERPLAAAVAAPRLYHAGRPDVTVYEAGNSEARIEGLRRRGHLVAEAPEIARVNAVHCPAGFQEAATRCVVSNDRRGHGLAQFVQF